MPNIVISYRRDDSKWIADRVFDRFESHYGKGNVFMDIDSIPFGLDFREHIRETLDRCDVMVALVGPNWIGRDQTGDHILNETDWVRIEIETALNKKIPLIPLLIDGSRMPKPEELPGVLRNFVFRQSAAIDRDNFRAQMDKLIASIDQHLLNLKRPLPIDTVAAPVRAEPPQPRAVSLISIKTAPPESHENIGAAADKTVESEKERRERTVNIVFFVGICLAAIALLIEFIYWQGATLK